MTEFAAGDACLLFDRKGRRYLIELIPGAQFHHHHGLLPHDDIIGIEEGTTLESSLGRPLVAVRPRLADFALKMPRGAAVVYAKDAGAILVWADIKPGNAMPFQGMPIGTIVHNIEMKPGKGGQMARSAGAYAQLVAREGAYATLRMRSGEMRKIHIDCRATIGEVGHSEHNLRKLGKAGASRWRGKRPTVRGVAMNPVDHPHGGGEGRTSGGRHPVSPWGTPTKGAKTRKKKPSDTFIVRRRKKK